MQELTLYQIKEEYLHAFRELHAMEGLTPEIIEDSLAALQCSLEQKALSVGAYIRNLEALTESMKRYEEQMYQRRKAAENKIARLKDYLAFHLEHAGIKKIAGVEFNITLALTPAAVVVDDESKIAKEFMREKVVREVNKIAIKEAIEDGQLVNGAHLEKKLRVSIK